MLTVALLPRVFLHIHRVRRFVEVVANPLEVHSPVEGRVAVVVGRTLQILVADKAAVIVRGRNHSHCAADYR